jgi:hypothetical protein
VLFIGSQDSDVHLLASCALSSNRYWRIDVGDVESLVNALRAMEWAIKKEHDAAVVPIDGGLDPAPVLRANAVHGNR